jgi:methylase of polypeptide subunit release factors
VGTDVNPRALALAHLTLGLSEVEAELELGDRFAPMKSRRVDLIVSNPPMVIGPSSRFTYRDSGLQGDAMSAAIVSESADHLTEGGWCQLLAHWLHVRGQDWRERVAGWLPDGVDAWIIQREALDPARYVEMWLADGGDVGTPAYRERYEQWLAWFDEHRIEAVGMGWISLRRTDALRHVQIEDLRQSVEQPVGAAVVETFDAWAWADRTSDAALLEAALVVPEHVQLQQVSDRVGAGWQPRRPVLVQQGRMRREAPTDAFGAVLVGLLDGARPVREAAQRAAQALGVPESAELLEGTADAVRGLLEQGFLAPPAPRSAARTAPSV